MELYYADVMHVVRLVAALDPNKNSFIYTVWQSRSTCYIHFVFQVLNIRLIFKIGSDKQKGFSMWPYHKYERPTNINTRKIDLRGGFYASVATSVYPKRKSSNIHLYRKCRRFGTNHHLQKLPLWLLCCHSIPEKKIIYKYIIK